MHTTAVFPHARVKAGMYESFYLRAVSPREPVGVWIRHTVHKAPAHPPTGSVWCTVFDAARGAPWMHKTSTTELAVPADGWIEIGGESSIGPRGARGSCGAARWALEISSAEPTLCHLVPAWLYRAPLPRTKPTSPAPAAVFNGVLELAGRDPIELRDWHGMVGHNWGAEHAARWIWLHATDIEEDSTAWLDVALGRVELAGRMTPWVANGAISLAGRRHRLGGIGARGVRVAESVRGARVEIPGRRGTAVEIDASIPDGAAAGWRYSDPDGGAHDVVNCSVAALELTLSLAGETVPRRLTSRHGGVYELGMRERDHGVTLAPFRDG